MLEKCMPILFISLADQHFFHQNQDLIRYRDNSCHVLDREFVCRISKFFC